MIENIYVCSDLHFGHHNIIQYENRPYSCVDEMNEILIKNWNSVVGKKDKVFLLGDVSFTGKEETVSLVQRLQGRKILIMGNHDRQWKSSFWIGAGFEAVSPYPVVYKERLILMHEPPEEELHKPFFYVYGHVHGNKEYPDHSENSACVCIERLGYRPALLEDVISGAVYMSK